MAFLIFCHHFLKRNVISQCFTVIKNKYLCLSTRCRNRYPTDLKIKITTFFVTHHDDPSKPQLIISLSFSDTVPDPAPNVIKKDGDSEKVRARKAIKAAPVVSLSKP